MLKPFIVVILLEVAFVLAFLLACLLLFRAFQRRWRELWTTNRYAALAGSALIIVALVRQLAH